MLARTTTRLATTAARRPAARLLSTPPAAAAGDRGDNAALTSKASKVLTHLLHGNAEVRAHVEEAHSKLLARNASVTELAFHRVRPGSVAEYLEHARAPPAADGVRFHGAFLVEVGDLDKVVHITTYNDYRTYEAHRATPDPALLATLRDRYTDVCRDFGFWDEAPASADAAAVYELRTYRLKPGSLLEWGTHWRKGVAARREYCHPVQGWFSQLGELNTVHHLWVYKDLEARRSARELAWKVPGWSETVFHTVPLLQSIQSNVMRRIL